MTTLRLTLTSILFCGFLYVPVVFGFAQILFPENAEGSLLRDTTGKIIGSELIAQNFTSDRYFHPRPSACDYNAQAACGSNLSPTNAALATRAEPIITANNTTLERPIPADLVTASGSGLDPHITLAAARYQIPRIAKTRHLSEATVEDLLPKTALVNVLDINLALDQHP